MLQVQRHAALVAVERLKKLAIPRPKHIRPHRSADIAALGGVFDLDHLRAEVGEQHRAERAGAILLDGDHRDAIQWQGALALGHAPPPRSDCVR
ncbi:hypothetical protein GALL_554170 [mine drainage metagenome]|uniref:Uncharacterized protein n=1 Tax=mine drainage metagenome TaxID=410659 RepID=A0A1J5P5F9_9ZZZZ